MSNLHSHDRDARFVAFDPSQKTGGSRAFQDWTPTLVPASGAGTARLLLSLAISDYDHVRDLLDGSVRPEGIDLLHLKLSVEEIFFRFTKFREWEVSEMSMAKFTSLISQNDRSLIAIPVFPSRVFRHSSIYVRRDGPVREPKDLAGRRVGLPEWAQTAAIYSRGFLAHQFGLDIREVEWVQAGVNEPGRAEKVSLSLPEGVRLTPRPDKSLNGMLLDKEVDAILTAHAPQAFEEGHPDIVRLFEDYRALEDAYWRDTGVFPIMHAIVVRAPVLERFPWVAANLMKAFEEAKRRSFARFDEITASRYPIPWMQSIVEDARATFGGDLFPYGVEPNRKTLETFLAYAHEQGVCHRLVSVDELFPAMVSSSFKV